jgi:hypothetical protein
MSTPTCPPGFTLTGRTCYSTCVSGTTAYADSPEYCVSTLPCPVGTIEDLSGLACTKVEPVGRQELSGTSCPEGYTEWTTDMCYINCPTYFYENGLDCRKRATLRRVASPTCNNWFLYVNDSGLCVLNPWYVLLVVGASLLFLVILRLIATWGNQRIYVEKPAKSSTSTSQLPTTIVVGGGENVETQS